MVLVDVEKFGDPARSLVDRLQVRRGMYGALQAAFDEAGIPWDRCKIENGGDGVLILVPADVSKNRLATRLPEHLAAAIEAHNADRQPPAKIRLRLALHAGEIHLDEHGQTSDSLIFAFRLLNSPEARSALATSPETVAIITSEWFYQNVIHPDPAAHPERYRAVRFESKETSAWAWVRLPKDASGVTMATPAGSSPQQVDHGKDQLTNALRIEESDSSRARQPALIALVERLLAIPTVAQEAGRRLLMDHLRPDMANAVPYFSQARHHVFSLVRTCMNYDGGVEELLSVVRFLEGESTPVRRLDETVAELLGRAYD
jgi:hypothetical protein